MFSHSSGFILKNPHFTQTNHFVGGDADPLLRYCVTDAAYDSSARESISHCCFPGTRTEYIQDIVAWMTGDIGRCDLHHLFCMQGPAGAGKTTIAQSCATEAEKAGALGASFFFSRDNGVIKLTNFFTTIAYQLGVRIDKYRAIVAGKVRHDPTLPTKNKETQLRELIIEPLLKLHQDGEGVSPKTILVDGLDESEDRSAQCEIVELIAKTINAHGNKVPLLWAFFFRPETQIVNTLSLPWVSPLCWKVELTVSQKLNNEIRTYLRGVLIRPKSHFDPPTGSPKWPSDVDLEKLVRMVDGFFIYATTLAKYIMARNSLRGPEGRMKEVLTHESEFRGQSNSPTSALDYFYRMILERVALENDTNVLLLIQQLLLLHHELPKTPRRGLSHLRSKRGLQPGSSPPLQLLANIVGHDLKTLERCLASLSSVLRVKLPEQTSKQGEGLMSATISFYHASFMDFLLDQERSRQFWIKDQRLWRILTIRCLDTLNAMHTSDEKPLGAKKKVLLDLDLYSDIQLLELRDELYAYMHWNLMKWCGQITLQSNDMIIEKLRTVDFAKFRRLGLVESEATEQIVRLPPGHEGLQEQIHTIVYVIRRRPWPRLQFNSESRHPWRCFGPWRYLGFTIRNIERVLWTLHCSVSGDDSHPSLIQRLESQFEINETGSCKFGVGLEENLARKLAKARELENGNHSVFESQKLCLCMKNRFGYILVPCICGDMTRFVPYRKEEISHLVETNQLADMVINLVTRRRKWELVNCDLIYSSMALLEEADFPQRHIHLEYFKEAFLEATRQHYFNKLAPRPSDTLAYIKYAEECLEWETAYIEPHFSGRMFHHLLDDVHLRVFVEPYSDLIRMDCERLFDPKDHGTPWRLYSIALRARLGWTPLWPVFNEYAKQALLHAVASYDSRSKDQAYELRQARKRARELELQIFRRYIDMTTHAFSAALSSEFKRYLDLGSPLGCRRIYLLASKTHVRENPLRKVLSEWVMPSLEAAFHHLFENIIGLSDKSQISGPCCSAIMLETPIQPSYGLPSTYYRRHLTSDNFPGYQRIISLRSLISQVALETSSHPPNALVYEVLMEYIERAALESGALIKGRNYDSGLFYGDVTAVLELILCSAELQRYLFPVSIDLAGALLKRCEPPPSHLPQPGLEEVNTRSGALPFKTALLLAFVDHAHKSIDLEPSIVTAGERERKHGAAYSYHLRKTYGRLFTFTQFVSFVCAGFKYLLGCKGYEGAWKIYTFGTRVNQDRTLQPTLRAHIKNTLSDTIFHNSAGMDKNGMGGEVYDAVHECLEMEWKVSCLTIKGFARWSCSGKDAVTLQVLSELLDQHRELVRHWNFPKCTSSQDKHATSREMDRVTAQQMGFKADVMHRVSDIIEDIKQEGITPPDSNSFDTTSPHLLASSPSHSNLVEPTVTHGVDTLGENTSTNGHQQIPTML